MGKTPCLLHLQVPHQLEPELEAALQNLWLLELDQEALSDKEKRLQQAPQLPSRTTGANSGGMWKFYTDDSPGVKVGPVPVLVMSLLFIASVFLLHIWGKYTRS